MMENCVFCFTYYTGMLEKLGHAVCHDCWKELLGLKIQDLKGIYMAATAASIKYAYKAERIKLDGEHTSYRIYSEISTEFKGLANMIASLAPEVTTQDSRL